MRRKPLRKTNRRKVERLVKRKVKSKIFRFILLGLIIGGFYYYNEVYLHTLESSVLYNKEYIKVSCVDGDTFLLDDETIRLLAIDTPELKGNEPFAKKASNFTCELLNNTEEIVLKQDEGNTKDKYGRTLAWVYLDDVFLQEALIDKGYAKIEYVNHSTVDRKLLSILENTEQNAKTNKQGIWQ